MAASGGVAPYQYSINAGGTYQPSGTFGSLAAGSYTIRIKDNVGCTKDVPVILGQPSALTATAVNTTPATCNGNDGIITVTGGGGTTPYVYSTDNGANYQTNTVFTAPAVGAYPNIKVKDANGCIASASTTVALVDAMVLELGPNITSCAGAPLNLRPVTDAQASIFHWSPDVAIDNINIRNPTVNPTATVTYTLNATWGACSRQDNITITVLNKPVPEAGPGVTICDNDSTILTASATNLSGTVNYQWTPAATVRDPNAASTIVVPASTQYYYVTVTDNYGCNFSVTDSVLVTVQPPVPAYAGHDTIAILGVPHQLTATGGTGYIWSPATPLNSPFLPTPLATLTNDTKFIVTVTDAAGCTGTDTVFVKVYEGPAYYTPNAFSPNGDGLNDIFRAIPVGIAKTEWFRVFNRYGELVFETNQWLKGWDGTYKGKKQPLGVYVWIIKGTDKLGNKVEMKGTVMLVQ
jgi:gliding motility-associated-like protein